MVCVCLPFPLWYAIQSLCACLCYSVKRHYLVPLLLSDGAVRGTSTYGTKQIPCRGECSGLQTLANRQDPTILKNFRLMPHVTHGHDQEMKLCEENFCWQSIKFGSVFTARKFPCYTIPRDPNSQKNIVPIRFDA